MIASFTTGSGRCDIKKTCLTAQSVCKIGTGFSDEDLTKFTEATTPHVVTSGKKPRGYQVRRATRRVFGRRAGCGERVASARDVDGRGPGRVRDELHPPRAPHPQVWGVVARARETAGSRLLLFFRSLSVTSKHLRSPTR